MKETLGQYLKREREARSISLDELSRGTRINKSFLEALERDDLGFFTQRDFIVGFLKGYTRYLGLPADEALKLYLRQAELERRKVNFRQLYLFPDLEGNKEEGFEVLNQNNHLHKIKISKWVYIKGLITIIALGASFYIHQILKNPDLSSQAMKNNSLPHLTAANKGGK